MAALLLLLGACASIPLSTMWRMRNFGAAELAAIDPAALRVATRMEPAQLRLDPAKAQLVLALTPRAGGPDEVHAMQLREASVANGDLVPGDPADWQVFRLAEHSAAMLREAVPRFTRDMDADYTGATFSVKFGFTDAGALAGRDALRATVRLALAADQQAFTLLDRVSIPVAQGDAAPPSAPSPPNEASVR